MIVGVFLGFVFFFYVFCTWVLTKDENENEDHLAPYGWQEELK